MIISRVEIDVTTGMIARAEDCGSYAKLILGEVYSNSTTFRVSASINIKGENAFERCEEVARLINTGVLEKEP